VGGAHRARCFGGTVALQKDLSELSLRMISEYALGSGLESDESAGRVVSAFEDVLSEYLARLYQVDVPGTEEERRARAEQALTYLRATVDRALAGHRERSEDQAAEQVGRSDLIAALAGAGESPARIRDTVLMTMLAAHHTTGVAISWTLYLLAGHPDLADRVADELDRVLGDRAVPEYGDLKDLPYLDMVLRETMRLYPPGPYGAREATEDLVLGDYTVPAGTTICEGATLAMVEAELVLAILLKRFHFHLAPGQKVTPIERFVLWAAEDIHMDLTLR
jgi:cytochrome P450